MINLVAQNEFIDDLFIKNNDTPQNVDLISFLRQDLFNFDLICDFNSYEDLFNASKENPLWEFLIDKVNTITYKSELNDVLNEKSFYNSFGEHNLFLINKSSIICDKLSNEYGYIFLCIENIAIKWHKYILCTNGIQLKVTNSNIIPDNSKLDCWNKLDNYCFPLTSIIIFDKYILGDKSDQKLTDNLYPLLEVLTKNNSSLCSIKISIITQLVDTDSIISKHDAIINFLKSINVNNVNLNIIKHDKAFYPRLFEGLHSRYILTNYFHFKCDDSFNFFKSNHKVNNDADVRINFLLKRTNYLFFKKEIEDIKLYLSKINNNPTSPKENHKILYYPDKSNPLLN